MLLYNLSLTSLFWTLFSVISTQFNTLQTFSGFGFNSFATLLLTVLLFSMAGVPPFIGFFSNLFLITLLINNHFVLLYSLFFVSLLIGLYFYIQNISFLHSTNFNTLNYPYVDNERQVLVYYYYSITKLVTFLLGMFYIDDFTLLVMWILN